VLGTINPVREIGRLAHAAGALFLVDGAPAGTVPTRWPGGSARRIPCGPACTSTIPSKR